MSFLKWKKFTHIHYTRLHNKVIKEGISQTSIKVSSISLLTSWNASSSTNKMNEIAVWSLFKQPLVPKESKKALKGVFNLGEKNIIYM